MPEQKQPIEWETWARQLRRWGLSGFAAALLESGGAFATLAAQGIYISKPFTNAWIPENKLNSLAGLLENPEECISFAHLLREQTQ